MRSSSRSVRDPSASALRMRANEALLTLRPRLLDGSSGSTMFRNLRGSST
jgi:hypothetical protein